MSKITRFHILILLTFLISCNGQVNHLENESTTNIEKIKVDNYNDVATPALYDTIQQVIEWYENRENYSEKRKVVVLHFVENEECCFLYILMSIVYDTNAYIGYFEIEKYEDYLISFNKNHTECIDLNINLVNVDNLIKIEQHSFINKTSKFSEYLEEPIGKLYKVNSSKSLKLIKSGSLGSQGELYCK